MNFNKFCVYPDNICNCVDCEANIAIATFIEQDYDENGDGA